MVNLPHGLEFDLALYFVDKLEAPRNAIPSYVRLDLRLGWKPEAIEGLEISLVGRNLLDEQHPEFIDEQASSGAIEIERSFLAQLSYRF